MKKLLTLSALVLIVCSCSAPKYTYYFDKVKNPSQVAKSSEVSPITVNPETFVASTSKSAYEVVTIEPAPMTATAAEPVAQKSKLTRTKIVKEMRQQVKDLKTLLKKKPTSESSPLTTKALKGKPEGLAIAGFVVALAGWLIPSLAGGVICFIVGTILSALGLKSERRGLAIAGLVLGILGLAIILIVGGALLAA